MNEVATVFRDMAAVLRARSGQNVTRLAYVKGEWQLGRDKLLSNGTQWVARVDWAFCGWEKWWDGRIRDYRLGYVVDRFAPPPRAELGDHDTDQWDVWNRGKDPWQFKWSLPLFNQVSGEEVLYSTDTLGGRDALAALMTAYADRLDSSPTDGKILPIIELGSSSYPHPDRGQIKIPVLDIIGWTPAPDKPRPPLPKAEPQAAIEGPRTPLTQDLDDTIPF
jgi:hypothetical protein